MATNTPRDGNRQAALESALIDEFLAERGCTLRALEMLPPARRVELLRAAAANATLKLAEIESRAHFVEDLHR